MPSALRGRIVCPWCGFEGAHVKESEKCLYAYCPECGINGPHFKTERQRGLILARMRPEGAAVPAAPAPTPAPTPTPTPARAPEPPPPDDPPPPTPTPTPTPGRAPGWNPWGVTA